MCRILMLRSDICLFSEKKVGEGGGKEVAGPARDTGNISSKKLQSPNPFLVTGQQEIISEKTEVRNRNPFEEDHDRLNPFVKDNDEELANEEEVLGSADSCSTLHSGLTNSPTAEGHDSFEDYESVISDIEETLSILSRNSRSTTPASELGYSSRTSTPSLLNGSFFSMSDLGSLRERPVSDKHIIPVVTVFDDLKDYLSDSDLSLDYKIALQRRRQKNHRNLNKQAQLSSLLTIKKCQQAESCPPGFPPSWRPTDDSCSAAQPEPGATQRSPDTSISPPTASFSNSNRLHLRNGDLRLQNPEAEDASFRRVVSESSVEGQTRRSVSSTREAATEVLLDENSAARLEETAKERQVLSDKVNGLRNAAELFHKSEPKVRSGQESLAPVRICVEKWENLFATGRPEDTHSLQRRKQLRTASLSTLLTPASTSYALPGREPDLVPCSAPSFARTFQACTAPTAGLSSRLAVNKSVSECNLAQWVGRPSLGGQSTQAGGAELAAITSFLGIDRSQGGAASLSPKQRRSQSLEPEGCRRGEATEQGDSRAVGQTLLLPDSCSSSSFLPVIQSILRGKRVVLVKLPKLPCLYG